MQETPQIFALLTVLCVLASLIVVGVATYRALRGRGASAVRLLVGWGVAALIYLAVSAAVSFFTPGRVIEQGQNWCFDDWCFAVDHVTRSPAAERGYAVYTTDVRIYNAARSSEAANGFWVFLRDENDRRYSPRPGSWSDVVATRVGPHQSAHTSMAFDVPDGVRELGLITGHGGGTPCALVPSLLEIGQGGCLFHRPNMIRIQ